MIGMRWLIVAFGTLLALAGRAGAQGPAVTAVNKAIEAQGGIGALERARIMSRKSSGMMEQNAIKVAFTSELVTDFPDRYRLSVEYGPQKNRFAVVVNRDKGWYFNNGNTTEMSQAEFTQNREEGYVVHLSTLAPLIRDKDIFLQIMPEGKFQGKPVTVVKAMKKGNDDILLCFDKASNVLVKMSRQTALSGLTADKEYVFGDYKEFNGVKLPTKMQELLNGRESVGHTIGEYRFHSSAVDKEFDKP